MLLHNFTLNTVSSHLGIERNASFVDEAMTYYASRCWTGCHSFSQRAHMHHFWLYPILQLVVAGFFSWDRSVLY